MPQLLVSLAGEKRFFYTWPLILMKRRKGSKNMCRPHEIPMGFPISQLESILLQNNFLLLPFEFAHYEALSKLPFHHNDPFDRMIIAQAQDENLEIISQDEKFKYYPVKVVWA